MKRYLLFLSFILSIKIANAQAFYPFREDTAIFMVTMEDRSEHNLPYGPSDISTLYNKKILYNIRLFDKQIINQDTVFSLLPMCSLEICWTKYIRRQNSDHIIVHQNGDSTIIKLNAALGDSWNGHIDSSGTTHSVTYTSSQSETILNKSDIVRTYTFDNGKEIKISEKYGIIKAFTNFENNDIYTLNIFSIPLLSLGRDITDARQLDFYEDGYTYGYNDSNYNAPWLDRYYKIIMLSKSVSANGDTIIYHMESTSKATHKYSPYGPISQKSIYNKYYIKITKGSEGWISSLNRNTCEDGNNIDLWYYSLSFSGGDTILGLQNLTVFEDGAQGQFWSFKDGILETYNSQNNPNYQFINTSYGLSCKYLSNSVVPEGCEKFGLLETMESIPSSSVKIINPTIDELKIFLAEDLQGENNISIMNSKGEILYQDIFQGNEFSKDIQLFPNGLYFIKIINNNKSLTEKLIIE